MRVMQSIHGVWTFETEVKTLEISVDKSYADFKFGLVLTRGLYKLSFPRTIASEQNAQSFLSL